MTCISTLVLAFMLHKSYQFNKPIRTADSPRSSAPVSIVYVACPQGQGILAVKQNEVILCSVYYVIFSKITTLNCK